MTETRFGLPVALGVIGWFLAPGTWFLALRLGWEATVLTAREGSQMIGFTFIHTSLLALPVILSAFLAQFWVVAAVVWAIYSLWKKHRIERIAWIQIGALALPVGILLLIPAIS